MTVRTTGTAPPLAPAIDLTAYRVLQESLTNAGRHGSGPVLVSLDHDPAGSTITVRNALAVGDRSGGAPTQRHGLIGMTERVAASGGTLRAGREGSHWVVFAQLPAQVPARSTDPTRSSR